MVAVNTFLVIISIDFLKANKRRINIYIILKKWLIYAKIYKYKWEVKTMGLIQYIPSKSSNDEYVNGNYNYALDYLYKKKFLDNLSVRCVFPYSNEELSMMYDMLPVEAKRVLTVGSSGDQVIHAIAHGARDITLIDGNPMAYPYAELKLAAIKNLSFSEFREYFGERHESILSSSYYAKVSHDLSERSRRFWEDLIMDYPVEDFQSCADFRVKFNFGFSGRFDRTYHDIYCDENKFNKLKEQISKCKVQFINADLEDFAKNLDGKYDLILLSNIADYEGINRFIKVCAGISNYLSDDGLMQLYYGFNCKERNVATFIEHLGYMMADKDSASKVLACKHQIKKNRPLPASPIDEMRVLSYSSDTCPLSLMVSRGFFDLLKNRYRVQKQKENNEPNEFENDR